MEIAAAVISVVFLIAPLVILAIMVKTAPQGYEDETGFHLGEKGR